MYECVRACVPVCVLCLSECAQGSARFLKEGKEMSFFFLSLSFFLKEGVEEREESVSQLNNTKLKLLS